MVAAFRLALCSFAILAGCADGGLRALSPDREPHFAQPRGAAPKVALVLSSGSRRGFAHVGVLAALERHGIRPDLIVGSSAGALVGALYASGVPASALSRMDTAGEFEQLFEILPSRAARSERFEEFVTRHLHEQRLERFPVPFAVVATGLRDGCTAVFNAGDAARAVHASASVPGFFTPPPIRGASYGDGGMASPVPVRIARALGAQRVIAIDVSYHPDWEPPAGFVDSIFYGALLMVRNLAEAEAQEADLVIRPRLPSVDRIEAGDHQALIESGAAAIEAVIPRLRELFDTRTAGVSSASGLDRVRRCERSETLAAQGMR